MSTAGTVSGRAPARCGSRRGPTRRRILLLMIAIAVTAVMALPLYAAFVGSLTRLENLGSGYLVPDDLHWRNWAEVWTRIPLARYLITTVLYSTAVALLGVTVATIAAYAISRLAFRGKSAFLYGLLISQVIPAIVLVVPLFRLATSLGIHDTYAVVVVVVVGMSLPLPTFLLRGYFDTLPVEVEEAARVDGCSRLKALFRVVLPVSGPALLTAFALVFFNAWQQFLIPLILAETPEKLPVAVGVYRLTGAFQVPWNLVMTAALIACLPPLIVYLVAQRFLLSGLTTGATK